MNIIYEEKIIFLILNSFYRCIDFFADIMASSSSSNKNSSTPNALTNSYFLYGTHPLKVPNNISYSNSTNDISSTYDQTSHHLSLHNGSLPISDKSTTKSLHNIPKSYTDDDETSEVIFYKPIKGKESSLRLDL